VKGRLPQSLDAAVQMTLSVLKFMPGREPAVIKQHLAEKAKAEADKVQADKEKRDRDRQQKNANPCLVVTHVSICILTVSRREGCGA